MSRLRTLRRWVARAHARPEAGFTLVELLAAVFIFAAISTATVTIIITALRTIDANNERVLAANVARSQVEYLRLQGASNIQPGLSTEAPPGTRPDYLVETSAEWVGLGQTASACEAAQPGQAYLRVRVAVTSPELDGPAVIDTIITPETALATEGTGAVAISVDDQYGDPVSGVQVVALDAAHPENSFTYVTGADGCLYVPQLTAPSTLNVTISKDGYVSSTPTGTQATVQLDPESLSKPTFLYAPSAGIEWTGALAEYPVPSGMPVTWSINQTGSPTLVGAVGTTVTGLWPTTSGFTAWAGDCTDADPQEYAALRPSFNLVGGEARRTELDLRPVRLRKLTPGAEVTVEHVGGGAGCTTTPFAAGTANDDGVLRVGLPNGSWSFTVTDGELSETIALPEPLAPPAEGQEEQVTIVPFTVFEPEPEPTETPTEFPTESPTPSPEPSP
jgi:prepilin-type N-terminal cleavage/methylation domain-containing protein